MPEFLAVIKVLSSLGGPTDPGFHPPGIGGPGSGLHPGWPTVPGWGGSLPGGPIGGVDPGYNPPGIIVPPPGSKPPEGIEPPPPGTTVPLPTPPGGQVTNPIVVPEYILCELSWCRLDRSRQTRNRRAEVMSHPKSIVVSGQHLDNLIAHIEAHDYCPICDADPDVDHSSHLDTCPLAVLLADGGEEAE